MKSFVLSYLNKRALDCLLFISFIVTVCTLPFSMKADELAKHYIIAFDQSIGNYRPTYASPSTLNTLNKVLIENGFNRESDYISIVGYSMPLGAPSEEEFVRPYKDKNGHPVICKIQGKFFECGADKRDLLR